MVGGAAASLPTKPSGASTSIARGRALAESNQRSMEARPTPAVNLLTGKSYPHHPVMMQVDLGPFPVEKDTLIEWNGLRVPAHLDCDIFNNNTAWGNHFYFSEQASRWITCWEHHSAVRSGLRATLKQLPVVDEEYSELVATFESVMRARPSQPYVVAELGARWGTWGARAVAFLRHRRPELDYQINLVESKPQSCRAIHEVMALNGFTNYSVSCGVANSKDLRQWLGTVSHVDLMDFDVQGAEHPLIRNTISAIEAKAYRLVIGTHLGPSKHEELKKYLLNRGWLLVSEMKHSQPEHRDCIEFAFRGRSQTRRQWRFEAARRTVFDWERVLREGCYTETERGPVCQSDGELVFDNARFVSHLLRS